MTDTEGFTPAAFHAQPGVTDWRITSWGAQAVFRASSLAEAARLVPRIVELGEQLEVEPDVDLRPEAAVVRIGYRKDNLLPAGAAALAAAISAAAGKLGLTPDPSVIQTVDIFVAQHEVDTRPFWTAVLGYDARGVDDAVDPLRRGPSLSIQSVLQVPRRGRTHIDVSVPADQAEGRVAAALAAGGRLVDDSRAPMWWTVASPDNHGVDIAAWTDTWDGS